MCYKTFRSRLRCRLDLFSSECASPPMSVGSKLSAWIDGPSGVLDAEFGRLVLWAVSGMAILHKGLFGDGRVRYTVRV
ncbi:hypothetical protein BHE74_00053462 [Ensete ventricosum]|nr:hypothetical protein GW17_00055448 [Ensete ventricosum]RWW41071.1 hypothetical protein BHE74_00053462 [Ensete ventricosum]